MVKLQILAAKTEADSSAKQIVISMHIEHTLLHYLGILLVFSCFV